VRIVKQVAGALAAAHAEGIVHRDLKPDNVFLVGGVSGGRASDDVRVVDFGAAKIIGSSRVTRQGIVFGTPHYMSPEQASGQPVDHRADVYALGVIMYEMFTGRVPFEADTYMGVLTQHMFVQPLRPSQVSGAARELGALEDITMFCLAKKPEERYGSMAELSEALDEVVQSRSDGRMEIADRVGARPSKPPVSVRYRMADELEPPSLAEMRVAIDSVLPPTRVIPWAWILLVAAVLVSAVVSLGLLARRTPPVGGVTAPTAPTTTGSVPGVPPPPTAAPSAVPTSGLTAPPAASASTSATSTPTIAPSVPPRRSPRKAPPTDDIGDPFAKH
jgi:serine/threonine-protein kinase